MKILVTGVAGQLGHDLMNELSKRGYEGIGSDLAETYKGIEDGSAVCTMPYVSMNICDKDKVIETITKLNPDVIIHCAAWTAVDAAEDSENIEKVRAINGTGTENLAIAAKICDAKMIYLSTDYVFSGDGDTPWDPDDRDFKPLNVYGETKLLGEEAVRDNLSKFFIVRIAWVFGLNGNNFIKTMLKLSDKYKSLRVVDDQIGTPTYTYDLARLLIDMAETDKYGYYHATNEGGYISWYDFAKAIFENAGIEMEVNPVSTKEYGLSKAKRPYNSRLNKEKLVKNGFKTLPHWEDALKRYLKELGR